MALIDDDGVRERRRGSPIIISIDEGSTEYLFSASHAEIAEQFTRIFPDANVEREIAMHSATAGTTIDILINLGGAAGGIVAAEILKDVSKDIWKALEASIVKRWAKWRKTSDKNSKNKGGFDNLVLSLPYKDAVISVHYHNIGPTDKMKVEEFVSQALPALGALVNDLVQRSGTSGPPFAAQAFRIPAFVDDVRLVWKETSLTLDLPICIACANLDSNHRSRPCVTCNHYMARPAPDKSSNTMSFDTPEREGDHFRQWVAA